MLALPTLQFSKHRECQEIPLPFQRIDTRREEAVPVLLTTQDDKQSAHASALHRDQLKSTSDDAWDHPSIRAAGAATCTWSYR